MLAREIQHRTKNLFAVVQAVVGRSFAGKDTVAYAEAAVLSRLTSLAHTHVLLLDKQWGGIDIAEVVGAEMSPYAGRVKPLPLASEASAEVSTRQIGGAIAAVGAPWQGVPACNGCHDVDGPGALPIYPSLAGQFAPYTRLQLMLWKKGQRGGDPMNIMENIAKGMTKTRSMPSLSTTRR